MDDGPVVLGYARERVTFLTRAAAIGVAAIALGSCSPWVDPCPVTVKGYSGFLQLHPDGGPTEQTCNGACNTKYCQLVDAGLIACMPICL